MTENRTKTLVTALVVLNVFLVGALAGGAFVVIKRSREAANSVLPLDVEHLPDAERKAFRDILVAIRRESQTILQDRELARTEVGSLLSSPTLDKEALSAALARARDDDLALRARIDELAVEFAANLPAKDRALLGRVLPPFGKRPLPNAPKK
jgi:uncharacterized membrane protein